MFKGRYDLYTPETLNLINKFNYYVELKCMDLNERYQIDVWLEDDIMLDYFKDYIYAVDNDFNYILFAFDKQEHAIEFKLMWSQCL